jgi:hypothetical protein
MAVQALGKPLAEMADNLTFILDELPKLTMPDDTRRRVTGTCERFRAATAEERARAMAAVESRPPEIGAMDPFPTLRPIAPRLEEEMRAYDALVQEARRLSGASALLEVLLNESGVNILRALRDLRDRLARLEENPPERTEVREVLACAVCAAPAVRFDLNVDRSTGERKLRFSGITCAFDLPLDDDVLAWARSQDASALHAHISGGMDAYCPACDRVYCRDHYQTDERYDEGFYDCTYGTCPRGHRRMIDD